ncbi:hypothetical protein MKW98_027336 [Papaver atlanticum]|uniref:Uncharacterized protein n=1 Tax=Papaver atlanticum TaxID=357466 RepID=A0AAD4SPP6_9MAGN|nr:hypothetical protein MKW98_027336 [Papaver atlanticum]
MPPIQVAYYIQQSLTIADKRKCNNQGLPAIGFPCVTEVFLHHTNEVEVTIAVQLPLDAAYDARQIKLFAAERIHKNTAVVFRSSEIADCVG